MQQEAPPRGPPIAKTGDMYLVQLLLPLRTPDGAPFTAEPFRRLRDEFTARFGGVTFYARAPAQGTWQDEDDGGVAHDDVIVVEVMVEALDRGWWARCRERLEADFRQQELVVRAMAVDRL
jgi:hypothetical protein